MRTRVASQVFAVAALVAVIAMTGCTHSIEGEWAVHEFNFFYGGFENETYRATLDVNPQGVLDLTPEACDKCADAVTQSGGWSPVGPGAVDISYGGKAFYTYYTPGMTEEEPSNLMGSPGTFDESADNGFFMAVRRDRENQEIPMLEAYYYWGFYFSTMDEEAVPVSGYLDFWAAMNEVHVYEMAHYADGVQENDYYGDFSLEATRDLVINVDGRTMIGNVTEDDEMIVFSDKSRELSDRVTGVFFATRLACGRPALMESDLVGTYNIAKFVQSYTPSAAAAELQNDVVTFDGLGGLNITVDGDEYIGTYSIEETGMIEYDIPGLDGNVSMGTMAYNGKAVVMCNIGRHIGNLHYYIGMLQE